MVRIAGAGLLASALALMALPAAASEVDEPSATAAVDLTAEQEAFVTSKLTQFGASAAQAATLVDALEAGLPWESDGGSKPISVTEETVDGFPYTVQRFADGSYVASGIAAVAGAGSGGIQPMSVSACATRGTSAGVTYGTNCLVKEETAKASAQFRASYSVWSTGQSIYDYKEPWVNYDVSGSVAGGAFSTSTAPGSKWVQYTWQANSPISTTTHYLKLLATTSGVSTYANY